MKISWPEIDAAIAAVGGLLAGVFVPIFRFLWKIRYNELHHIQASVDRIEAKLDQHILWHLDREA
jgi:hypothetical protein